MKKVISLSLALALLLSLLSFGAAAEEPECVSLMIRSDIRGLTDNDYDKIIVIENGNYEFRGCGSLLIADYAGNPYAGKLKPGRTYDLWFSLVPGEGCCLPEVIDESTVKVSCERGAKVWWFDRAVGTGDDGGRMECIMFIAEVTVSGSFFEQLFGRAADLFLKMRSWSLY